MFRGGELIVMLVGAPITGHESRKRDGRMGRIVNICNSQKMSRYSYVDVQVLKSVREFGGLWETSVILYLPQRKSPFDGKAFQTPKNITKRTHDIFLTVKKNKLTI